MKTKNLIIGFSLGVFFVVSLIGGAVFDRRFGFSILDSIFSSNGTKSETIDHKILKEESAIIDVAEKAAPSVVTISISKVETVPDILNSSPFDPFNIFDIQIKEQQIEQDIGTGFVVDGSQGLIVTNKHVVSDVDASYRVINTKDEVFEVSNIYRDPVNDISILKIERTDLPSLELGDSDGLRVGQLAIAIGTALGEFRHTVTTGVISGLGRGITAGSSYAGGMEQLDNVIQTDAAINPGNSGGPLLNSAGQVVGVNVAIAQGGQNIGFAIPINIIKQSLDNFETTGQFARPFLGIRYQAISKQAALLNEVPQGALVREVIENSPADKNGIKVGDIITQIGGSKISENETVAKIINQNKIGDELDLKIWREGSELQIKVKLEKREE
jgi:serine protease Do